MPEEHGSLTARQPRLGLVELETAAGAIRVHRPERRFPVLPSRRPLTVPTPPAPPQDAQSTFWTVLTPVLGSLTLVAFAFIVRNPVYLAVAFLVVLGMTGAVLGGRLSLRRRQRRQWERQRRRWLAIVERARSHAESAAAQQRDAYAGMHPPPSRLLDVVRDGALWERRPAHPDFLTVRLGLARADAIAPVVAGEESRADPGEPALEEHLASLVTATATVDAVPMLADLRAVTSLGVVGDHARDVARCLTAEVAALCSPTDLRIVGLVAPEAADDWDWVKWLPHARDVASGEGFSRADRAVTTSPDQFRVQLELVTRERQRMTGDDDHSAAARIAALPHVLVVIDRFDPLSEVARNDHLARLLAGGREQRVSVVVTARHVTELPGSCGASLMPGPDGHLYVEAGPGGRVDVGVHADPFDPAEATELARWLAPRRPDDEAGRRRDDTIRLSELLGVEDVAELGRQPPWRSQTGLYGGGVDPSDLLVAPVGVTDQGSVVRLNLRESAQQGDGPHGVMVGATGSGKSELLRTLVAGLVATHPPDLLTVLAIDFKGGAAFAGLEEMPHLVGLVTNLEEEPALIDRMQSSLDGEVRRRQAVIVGAGVDDIAQYRSRRRPSDPQLPYLLVVVDEFSELLTARPEFLGTLVAIGRLGRSLGIHMLLATQRLDEGRLRGLEANLRYRIALRTFTAQDSTQIIGSPVAYELPPLPGLAYLKVDKGLTRFKSALSTAPRRSGPTGNAPGVATALPFSLTGRAHRVVAEADTVGETELSVLRSVVVAQRTQAAAPVWLPPLPSRLTLADLGVRTPASTGPTLNGRPLGLVDEPSRQRQPPLLVDDRSGHLAVVGAPQSGKSTVLRALAMSAAATGSPLDVQLYAIDAGGGLAGLAGLPHVGAVTGRHEPDAIRRVLADVSAIVAERASAFRAAGVGTLAELRAHPQADRFLPHPLRAETWLLIDNIGVLRQEHPDQDLELGTLAATCLPFGVRLAVSAARWLDIRPALLDAIATRLELHLNDPADSMISRAAARQLADLPGRGLVAGGRQVQVALPLLDIRNGTPVAGTEADTMAAVAAAAETLTPRARAPRILPLPQRVTVTELPRLAALGGRGTSAPATDPFLLGVHEHRLAPVGVDLLRPGAHLLVYGDQGSGKTTLLRRSVDHLLSRGGPERISLHVVDLKRGLLDYAEHPAVATYCFTISQVAQLTKRMLSACFDRLPPPSLTTTDLLARSWWTGPEHVLLIDDYQLLLTGGTGPLGELVGPLAQAQDLGFHVICARTVSGSARSMFEDFGKRLQEVTPTVIVLPGDSGEGPVAAGVTARPGPAGRAQLVLRGRRPAVVQLLDADTETPQRARR